MVCIITDSEAYSDELDSGVVLNKGRRTTQMVKTAHVNHCCRAFRLKKFTMHEFLQSIFGYEDMNGRIDARLELHHYTDHDDSDDFYSSLADPANLPKEVLGCDVETSDSEWQAEDSSESEYNTSDDDAESDDYLTDDEWNAKTSNPSGSEAEGNRPEQVKNSHNIISEKVRKRKKMNHRSQNTSKSSTRIVKRRKKSEKNISLKTKVISSKTAAISNKSGGVAVVTDYTEDEWEINLCSSNIEPQPRAEDCNERVISPQRDNTAKNGMDNSNDDIEERVTIIDNSLEPRVVVEDIMKDTPLSNAENDIDINNSGRSTHTREESTSPLEEICQQPEITPSEDDRNRDVELVHVVDNATATTTTRREKKWKLSRFWRNTNKKRIGMLKTRKSKSKHVIDVEKEISDDIGNVSPSSPDIVEIISEEENDQYDSDDTLYDGE
ncbi:hypothetical protein PV327_010101 [Microctonus hyperodae]|uniref:Uncharacterized protein n=1 Tax=Microctonus hyperodae TaxID=165561 RepID=A0AA39KGH1_MICHY|nr:hypothetical protein PV327_010101 [Microctonus hyperodae]